MGVLYSYLLNQVSPIGVKEILVLLSSYSIVFFFNLQLSNTTNCQSHGGETELSLPGTLDS